MQVARETAQLPGIQDSAVVMGTEANKEILREAGLLTNEAAAASADDLVIAVLGEAEAITTAISHAENLLKQRPQQAQNGTGASFLTRSIHSAVKTNQGANLAIISVSGKYAAAEAWEALHSGLHVLLFSDNVSLDDEVELKQYARQHGLLLMGPGAGTALINGIGLGFANKVREGPVGIVSAAGTGLQEVSCLLDRYGSGVSQGIGTGGRDLNERVGGIMMLAGLEALQNDPDTKAIILISKPPSAQAAQKILDQIKMSTKPTTICFLGAGSELAGHELDLMVVDTLQEAAYYGALSAGAKLHAWEETQKDENQKQDEIAATWRERFSPNQRYLRGLFSGGTLCYEAQVIWRDLLEEPVSSNAPLSPYNTLRETQRSTGHTALDLGEEEFTVGRPHPMIDNDLRVRRMLQEARDPQTAVVMLDIVLGFGAHPDPASELGPAVSQARELAYKDGRELAVIASITGTGSDPQGYEHQTQALKGHGVILCDCNASAARLASKLVCDR